MKVTSNCVWVTFHVWTIALLFYTKLVNLHLFLKEIPNLVPKFRGANKFNFDCRPGVEPAFIIENNNNNDDNNNALLLCVQ